MKIVYKVTVKESCIARFEQLADKTLIPEARKLTDCKLFNLYQNKGNKQEFIFYEIWDNEESVHAYKKELVNILGKPHPGEEFPAHMNDMIEADEDLV